MNHKTIVLFGTTVVGGLVLGVLVASRFISFGGSAGEWPEYTSADTLVKDSDRIIIAQYLDASPYMKPRISAATGQPRGSVSILFRRFKVVESLKGDATTGDTSFALFTSGYTTELDNGKSEFTAFEVVPLLPGQEYVLFLYGTPRREGYPAEYGDILWAPTGEPGIAQIDTSGNLSFKSTDRHKDEQGLGAHSGSPFSLSKEQIRSIVATSQGTVPYAICSEACMKAGTPYSPTPPSNRWWIKSRASLYEPPDTRGETCKSHKARCSPC